VPVSLWNFFCLLLCQYFCGNASGFSCCATVCGTASGVCYCANISVELLLASVTVPVSLWNFLCLVPCQYLCCFNAATGAASLQHFRDFSHSHHLTPSLVLSSWSDMQNALT
jgi:hypothetical protein